jgi:hypothetical protein
MRRISNHIPILLSCFFGIGLLPCANAQDEFHHFTVNLGGGYTPVVGRLGDTLEGGGNVQVGGGFNFNRYFGVLGTFSFNHLGVARSALNTLEVPDGQARVYSFTVDPKFTVPFTRGSFYVVAGGGWLRRTVEFTRPTVAETIIFDPWWGYFGPALVPANQILGTITQDTGVWDVGVGFNVPLPRTGLKMYIESRYYDGLTDNTHTMLVPITVGIRW